MVEYSLSSVNTNIPTTDGTHRVVSARSDGLVQILDGDSWEELHRFEGHTDWVRSAVPSADGKKIITTSDDKTIRILSADSAAELQKFDHPAEGIVFAALAPDETKIITGRKDGTVQIWDADLKYELQKFEGHTGTVHFAVLSPDGKRAATHCSDGTLRIWDADSGEELKKIEGLAEHHFSNFISDGKKLIIVSSRQDASGLVTDVTTQVLDLVLDLEEKPAEDWQPLFDGESLAGWSLPVYGGDGEVDVQEGNLVIGRGASMTGIRYEKEFPKVNYEIRYEARRTQGYDFFAACTFPVKEVFCTFINGGWGGGLTGLSSIDGYDASENQSSSHFDYLENTWYRFRIQVTDDKIQVWITPQDREGNWGEEKSVIEIEMEDQNFSTRLGMGLYEPLGFSTWMTEGELRNIEYRMLEK